MNKKGSFMWAVERALDNIVTKRKSKDFLLKNTRFGTPKLQSQEGAKNYHDLEFDDYFAVDWEVVEEPKKTLSDKIILKENDDGFLIPERLNPNDVKDFIATIKKRVYDLVHKEGKILFTEVFDIIDEEAGEQLIK